MVKSNHHIVKFLSEIQVHLRYSKFNKYLEKFAREKNYLSIFFAFVPVLSVRTHTTEVSVFAFC